MHSATQFPGQPTNVVAAAIKRGEVPATLDERAALTARVEALDGENARLRERLSFWAKRPTIAELMQGADEKDEWLIASVEERIRLMGERKREHDAEIIAARQALEDNTHDQ